MPAGLPDMVAPTSSQRALQRESSDEYEDYGDQYLDTFPSKTATLQQTLADTHLDDDDLPDTTMLDSVILPAIASVSTPLRYVKINPY